MHEVSLMSGILEAVEQAAREAGAQRVTVIALTIGDMTEVVPESLSFAFEALSEGTMAAGADLRVTYVEHLDGVKGLGVKLCRVCLLSILLDRVEILG